LIKSWNFLKDIFGKAWQFLVDIWNSLLTSMSTAITNFANLFIKGLNGLISILNKIPGVNIDRVSSFRGGNGGQNTTINLTIQGSADENTINETIKRMRSEINRKGVF